MMPGGHAQTENKYFNWRDKSCLHVIAKSRNMVRLRFFKNSNYSMCGYPVFGEMCAGVVATLRFLGSLAEMLSKLLMFTSSSS